MISARTWQKNYDSSDKQIPLILIESRFNTTQAMKMLNNWRENLPFGDWVDLVNSVF